jgi:hypothetical protein
MPMGLPATEAPSAKLPAGSRLELEDDRPARCVDRYGHVAWSASWQHAHLSELRLWGPDRREVIVRAEIGEHAVFGPCGGVFVPDEEEPRARFASIRWEAPQFIMPMDVPAALPSGSGTAILNALSVLARRAGRTTLRYRGPYPTAALFDTLGASFRCASDPAQALARFTADVEARAARADMSEVPVDFIVSPHAWVWTAPDVCAQVRDGLERVYVRGKSYDRLLASHRTLVRDESDPATWQGRIDIAGRPWAVVIRLDEDGEVLDGPHPLPPVESQLLGEALPRQVTEVLAQVLASRAPEALRSALLAELSQRPAVWADTGPDIARLQPDRFELHAVLGERLPELDARAMLTHLGGALEPVAQRAAQARLATAAGS